MFQNTIITKTLVRDGASIVAAALRLWTISEESLAVLLTPGFPRRITVSLPEYNPQTRAEFLQEVAYKFVELTANVLNIFIKHTLTFKADDRCGGGRYSFVARGSLLYILFVHVVVELSRRS